MPQRCSIEGPGNREHSTMPRCPVCDAHVDLEGLATPPFCSERCRVVDLGRWLDEAYAVPQKPSDADEDGDGEGPIPPKLLRGDDDEE
jgi:hypothetical protein